jgi:hypothetical protein
MKGTSMKYLFITVLRTSCSRQAVLALEEEAIPGCFSQDFLKKCSVQLWWVVITLSIRYDACRHLQRDAPAADR